MKKNTTVKEASATPLKFLFEKRLFRKMNKLFGNDLNNRFSKLTEEYHELLVAADDMLVNGIIPDDKTEIIDELADLNAVLFHIAALLGYSQRDLQKIAYKKIAGREKNPEYMRKHPHEKKDAAAYKDFKEKFVPEYGHFYDRFYTTK